MNCKRQDIFLRAQKGQGRSSLCQYMNGGTEEYHKSSKTRRPVSEVKYAILIPLLKSRIKLITGVSSQIVEEDSLGKGNLLKQSS